MTGPRPRRPSSARWRRAEADDCVVIAEETSSANLRWAGNTLTTNGVSRSRQLTVIAIDRRPGRGGGGRHLPGRGPPRPDRGRGRARRSSGRRGDARRGRARPLPGPGNDGPFGRSDEEPGWDSAAGPDRDRACCATSRPRSARRCASAGGRPEAVRVRRARSDQHVPRQLGRAAAAARPADRAGRARTRSPLTWPARRGPARPPATSPTSTSRPGRRAQPSGSEWAKRSVELPAGRYETLLPPTAVVGPDDLPVLVGRGARTRRTAGPSSASPAAGPGSASS